MFTTDEGKAGVRLTNREVECLGQLCGGRTAKQIAKDLCISFRTVEAHIYNIKLKYNCRTRLELVCRVHNEC